MRVHTVHPALRIILGAFDGIAQRMVTAGDIAALRARVGADVTLGTNYLFDLNLSGTINASDVSAAKSRAGLVLLP